MTSRSPGGNPRCQADSAWHRRRLHGDSVRRIVHTHDVASPPPPHQPEASRALHRKQEGVPQPRRARRRQLSRRRPAARRLRSRSARCCRTTGSLAFLGPPEIAGVNLGIKEVNDAGGVLGKPVEVIHRDSGDTKTDIATQSTSALLGQGVSAVIGAASSGVSKTVINQITGAGVIQFSPANTSPDFTTWDDKGLYWRTAPSDVLQGKVLGNYMATCGAQTVGMVVLNDCLRHRPGQEHQGILRGGRRPGCCRGTLQ